MTIRSLYISYDGMLEPLPQSQVLPYLRALRAYNVRSTLLTFEKSARTPALRRVRDAMTAAGIRWHSLRYHNSRGLVLKAWDLLVGTLTTGYLALAFRPHIIHARSYVAATMAWTLRKTLGIPYIFDIRGVLADFSKVDPRFLITTEWNFWQACLHILRCTDSPRNTSSKGPLHRYSLRKSFTNPSKDLSSRSMNGSEGI